MTIGRNYIIISLIFAEFYTLVNFHDTQILIVSIGDTDLNFKSFSKETLFFLSKK